MFCSCETPNIIITIGGTSVGSKDYIPNVISQIGKLMVHGVSIRPGKPIAIGYLRSNGKKVPIRGRVCMDLTMIDITGLDDIDSKTEVTVISSDKNSG